MILEHAVLSVPGGRDAEFRAAFEQAAPIIAGSPGFVSLRMLRCLETAGRFLLLVEWDTVEDHTEGFRQSPAYQQWRSLLHHFYDPFPTVEHYEVVTAR